MTKPVVIIGAGLSGLSCARKLLRAGVPVIILEKSRSFGGRCATRLWEGDVVDHGVPFFEEGDESFTAAAREVAPADLTYLTAPVLDAAESPLPSRGRRYTHRGGANRLARAFAQEMDVRQEQLVVGLQAGPDGTWAALVANQSTVTGRAIVLTCPGPQTDAILRTIGVSLPPLISNFSPCLTGFFAYKGEGIGSTAQALARQGEDRIQWTVCENHKPGRIQPGHTVLVAHGSDAFSQRYLESPPEIWLELLRQEVSMLWQVAEESFLRQFGHRWRYARCWPGGWSATANFALPPGIFLSGDTVVGSSVEAVWRSGETTAQAVAEYLQISLA